MKRIIIAALAGTMALAAFGIGASRHRFDMPPKAYAASGFLTCFNWGTDESWSDGLGTYSTISEDTYPGAGIFGCITQATGFIELQSYNTVTHAVAMRHWPLSPVTFLSCTGSGSDYAWASGTHTYTTVGTVTYSNVGVPVCLDTNGNLWVRVRDTSVGGSPVSMQPYPYPYP